MLSKNVAKNNMSVCTKIAIQINCKIGGAPWLVTIPKKVYNYFFDFPFKIVLYLYFIFLRE